MMVLAVFTFGYISLGKLPVNLLPEIAYPAITVRTEYPGAGPEDVEERVSERVQEALSVLPGLKEISSISKPELSDVTLEFAWGTNVAFATQNIREKLDRTFLPDDVMTPIILRYDPTLDPVIRIGVSGQQDLIAVRLIAEDDIQRKLETIQGVAAVKVRGGLEEEIHVEVDKNKLKSLNLTMERLNQRLAAENVNMAAGTIKEGDTEYLVRTLNQFMDLDEIMHLVITRTEEGVVRLGSIALVTRTHKEQDIISRINGRESVEIQIFKEAGANIVTLAERVKERLLGTETQRKYVRDLEVGLIPDPEVQLKEARERKEKEKAEEIVTGKDKEKERAAEERGEREGGGHSRRRSGHTRSLHSLETDPEILALQAEADIKKIMHAFIAANLPEDIQVRVLSDQSRFIQNSINEVKSSGLIGGFLAVLILYLFLRKPSSTFIIALAIPISVIATFAPMFMTRTSINIMSLGGLALGIGMLLDNSIIVLESIFRCREEGDSIKEAAVRGVREIGGAAIASTLTTVAVFFPIAFVEGIAGQIFRDQALTVVFSLLVSLAVALFFIPMLASRQLGASRERERSGFRFTCFDSYHKSVMGLNKPFFKVLAALLLLFVLFIHLTVEILGFLLFWSGRICTWVFARFFTVLVKVAGILLWPLAASFDRIFQTLARAYPPTLRTLLTNRAAIVVVAAIVLSLLYGSFNTARELGQEILPEVHQGELIAHLGLHVGAPVEQTNRVVARAEKETMKVKEIEWVSSTIGIARDEISSAEEGEHTAKIYIKIEGESGDLRSREERVLAQLRDIYASFLEILTCRFTRPTIFSVKSPVQVEIKGIRLDEIHEAARLVEERMHQIPGLEDVKSSVQRGSPEVRIRFNREKLARYSLDTATLASLISESVKGMVPTRFMSSEHKIDILVRVNQDDIACVKDLKDLVINPQSDAPIPLSAVADIRIVEGPSEIRRIWGQRAAIVSANLSQFDMGGTAQRISATISPIEEEGNLTLNIGGQGKELESAMDNMYLALCLAIFLVYIVMASQFESLYQPFIIICSIPLAFIGVVYILYWLKINISVVVFIGGIMLAGIVVNNAIVLVDYINQLRRRGMEKTDAIIAACRIRLRPILMTTATTVLGLLPLTGALGMLAGPGSALHLGLGEGMEIRAPMAITVIAGLISSTLLTLFIIPLVYSLTDRVFSRLGAALKRG
jgi:HAE1 family hydrophobic/amphiphilic exporter-1